MLTLQRTFKTIAVFRSEAGTEERSRPNRSPAEAATAVPFSATSSAFRASDSTLHKNNKKIL